MDDIDFGRWGVTYQQDGLVWRTPAFRLGGLSEADCETQFGPMVRMLGKRDTPAGPRYDKEFDILCMV